MIRRIKHKGLKRLHERGETRGISPGLVPRLVRLVGLLDIAVRPEDVNVPGCRLHRLKGGLRGYWSLSVSRNWRLVFRFEDEDVVDLNLVDYH